MLNEIELLKTDIAILWLKRIPPVNNHLISKENIFPGVGSSEETDSIGIWSLCEVSTVAVQILKPFSLHGSLTCEVAAYSMK